MLKKLIHFLQVDIWNIPSQGDYHPHALLIEVLKKLLLAVRFFTAKRVMSHAAALTYSTLLAIVPIFAVVFAIARGFGFNKYIEEWFRDAFNSQPQASEVIINFVNSYLVHTKSGVILGVGLIFMLYTVLMLVRNIELTFNEIWQVKKLRAPFRMFTDYVAMLFMFPIFIVLASGVSIFMATLADRVSDAMLIGPFMRFLMNLFPYALMSVVFIALYVFMPNTHVKLRYCIIPGILAGVAMQCLQLVYIHSQIWMSSYNAIYGSFAALPLFMLWVQLSWTICLFGAELCYTNQNLEFYDYDTKTMDISHRYRMLMSALLMSKICKRADLEQEPYTALELRQLTGIPIRIVNDLLYNMIDAGMLIESTPDEKESTSRFSLIGNAEKMTVGALIDRLEAQGTWRLNVSLENHYNEEWKKVVKGRLDYLNAEREILLKDL